MWWAGAWLAASLQLTWEAPAQCPTKAEIDARIVQLLSPEILERAPPLTVRAHVEALADSEWVLELEIKTVAGLRSRTVESPDCTSLADLTALVVALAVDPLAVAAATV